MRSDSGAAGTQRAAAMDEVQGDVWFRGLADELARALLDAGECGAACEELLEAGKELVEPAERQRLLAAVVAPAAICGVFIDLIDRPPALVLAAARVCRDASLGGAEQLEALEPSFEWAATAAAMTRAAESCGRLLDASQTL
jgi:hypothetical protein